MPKVALATPSTDLKAPAINYLSTISKDAPAGLVVFLVALPLCLGISLASGAPLLAGVITGIVGGILVSWLSGSQLSVSGPAAGLTAIIVSALSTLGSFEAVLTATVLAGILQLVLGFAKAGIIGMYFPSSVIRGMLAAIGLILILKQIPHFLGADSDYFEDMNFLQFNGENTFSAIGAAWRSIQPGSAIIGAVSLFILVAWDSKFVRRLSFVRLVPGALVVVTLSIIMNKLLGLAAPSLQLQFEHLVKLPTISSFSDLVAELNFPDWSFLTRGSTYVVAFTIGIVASLETLLSVEAVDKLDPHKRHTPQNRELLAQGVGNVVSGLIGGLPLTAVIVRSSANINAGGQTKVSAFIHGLLLLGSLLFLAGFLNQIPLSALAAILLIVGFKLTKPALYSSQWRLGWPQFLPFVVTVVAILFTDLLKGVCFGLAVGIFYILKANLESAYYFHDEPSQDTNTVHIKLSEQVTFLNKASIVTTLDQIPYGKHVILDGSDSEYIDYDVLEAIQNFRITAAERDINLEVRNITEVPILGH
ncbi:sulphate transporter [Hymenobacter roseosalivarius DSM 11622]|uniref:Sulphate transporter n=1 Tax=Hymenobacter roseosalivarius DSM 11622 TaxID=645990 RepID=A0A1W1VHK7_9BACT|nr:SulP family inorganic anion transporter [Hymenobacter roseosalivarius]SMB92832.1 sulphate transporter [Hymenobacter roseosalivarius DSM 11622]